MKKMLFKLILYVLLCIIYAPVVIVGMMVEIVGRIITAMSHFFFLRPQEFVRDMKVIWKDVKYFFSK